MELLTPHTPTAIAIIALLGSLVLLRLAIDIREIISARRMKCAIRSYVNRHYQPTTTAIIELRRRADTILPLLDQLQAQHNKHIDILVIVKHTAGKNAQPTLANYQKTHPELRLVIAKHRKGKTLLDDARTTARGDIVVQLTDQQTISSDFFEHAARSFIDNRVSIVMPRQHLTATMSLGSAAKVVLATWKHFFQLLHLPEYPLDRMKPGFLYRRTDLATGVTATATYLPQIALQTASSTDHYQSWYRHAAQSVITLVAVLVTVLLFSTLKEADRFFVEFFIGCYVVHFGLIQLSLRGYSVREQINIILFAPFSLIILPLIGMQRCGAWAYRSVRS